MDDRPICIDLFCGLGGFSEGFLAEGYRCLGFDIEAHDYGTGGYPGEFHLRDVRSIHGSELKDAAVIVASPPCQAYSYRAMPWKRAKALPPPDNTLFNECFRIQREAIAAAGHHIPLIVENVRGAQKWVGRSAWNYGSFHLWGDVPALMPHTFKGRKHDDSGWTEKGSLKSHNRLVPNSGVKVGGTNLRQVGFNVAAVRKMLHGDPNVTCEEGRKVSMNFHEHEKTGKPGRSFQSVAVEECGIKGISHRTKGHWTNPAEHEGVKNGNDWFGSGENCSLQRRAGSKSSARKRASAMIAKIPLPLSLHLARVFKPERSTEPSRAGREE